MNDTNLTKQFSERLREAMLSAGLISPSSIRGAGKELVKITGYSKQICQRYLKGEAMPGISKIMEIATQLKVSPGWLVFGDSPVAPQEHNDKVVISNELLKYIFVKTLSSYTNQAVSEDFSLFLVELANAVSAINGTEVQSKKIIDLAFSSRGI